ncbi:MAG: phage holin family protein [Lewinellaceae bacterium]|nr:phage holin family protein [Saprospiraceae bacterium]MCB9340661.1 phage holin family protein [Lewinellaceae bacterium]
MKETEEILQSAGETVEYARQYIQQQGEYIRLEVAERSSNVVSSLATGLVIGFFCCLVLIMLSLTVGLWLGARWGSYPTAFLFLSIVYMAIAALLYLFRKPLITSPVLDMILDAFFENRNPGKD